MLVKPYFEYYRYSVAWVRSPLASHMTSSAILRWRATPRTKRNENNTRRTYKILAKTARSSSGKRWPPHLSDNIGRNNQFHGTLSACPRFANTSSILQQVVGWKRGRRERGP